MNTGPQRKCITILCLILYHFLKLYCRQTGKRVDGFSDDALEVLLNHEWPGNVRQLINVFQRAMVLSNSHEITLDDLPSEIAECAEGGELNVGILSNGRAITRDSLHPERTTGGGAACDSALNASSTASPVDADSVLDADSALPSETSATLQLPDGSTKLDDVAKVHVLNVLANENGNKASAARKLGIHRRKLYRLLERFETET
mgnify:CR=1 FL=1